MAKELGHHETWEPENTDPKIYQTLSHLAVYQQIVILWVWAMRRLLSSLTRK